MKRILLIQLGLGIAVISLSFGAQASIFYQWNHGRSEIKNMDMVTVADNKQREAFHRALWNMWHPPARELLWLRWIGLGMIGVACIGFGYMRRYSKIAEPASPNAAIARRFQLEQHRRGVGGPERSTEEIE